MSLQAVFTTLLAVAGINVNAQVSAYSTTSIASGQTYTPLSGATGVFGTNINATLDNAVAANIPIGFNFNFNDKTYTTCNVSFNGFITFGAMTPAALTSMATDFTPISSSAPYEGVIAVYARDLKGVSADVLYQTSGVAGSRTFTIQWIAYRDVAPAMRMQIILHESDVSNPNAGMVELKYDIVTATSPTSLARTGQVGLRGENNTDYHNRYLPSPPWPTTGVIFNRGQGNLEAVATRFLTGASAITAVTRLTWSPPACYAPRAAAALPVSISSNSATINWTAPANAPVNGYEYLVSSIPPTAMNYQALAASYPKATTTPTGSVGAGVTSAPVSGLTANTLYYIYVRSNCGGLSGWSAAGTFTTLCDPRTVPYNENFGGATVGSIPSCTKREFAAGSATWAVANATAPNAWGFLDKHLRIQVLGVNNDATFFTEGVQLTGGVSYRLSYQYGSSGEFVTTAQNMAVSYGSAPVDAAMSVILATHEEFKGGPYTNIINFTPATTGVYYFGFDDYTEAGNATTLLDDILLKETTCLTPALAPASGLTSGSAFISWTPPAPNLAVTYQYYYSTANTPLSVATPPMGNVPAGNVNFTLGGLSPSTTYYFWIRSSCGGGDFSYWSSPITFTTAAGPAAPTCVPSGAGYSQDPNGITNVTFSNVDNTTAIELNNYGDYSYITGYAGQGTTVPFSITYRTGFSYNTKIWVDWNNDGDFDDTTPFNELVYTGEAAGTVPAILSGTFNVPGGATLGAHRMRIGGMDFGPAALTPCRSGSWQAYEDYTLFVTSPPPAIVLSLTSATVCQGTPVTVNITSPIGNYTSYTWTPSAGVTGTAASGFTFNPTTTTTYQLVGYNGATYHRATATVTITVKPTPSTVSIAPAALTVCQNATTLTPLTAMGGIISGLAVFSEDFNGTAAGWTQTNNTTNAGGDEDLAAWGLAPDGYNPFIEMHSNDNSQFAFTESDAPGPGSITDTALLSPQINLANLTSATLNFYEFYRQWSGDLNDEYRAVEIMNAAGTVVLATPLQNPGNVNIGEATNFALATVDLTPYVGTTIRLRFRYHATYDWGWAIDNVVVTGSGPSTYTWAPLTGLYNDAAGTIAYTGDARATVYPRPTATTAYTVTATAFGCPVSSTPMTVTVTPISGGTMAITSQTVCGGSPASDIVLSGVQGTVLYWQYADDAAFTINLTNIPASGGLTTLPGASVGAVTGPRYFRAVVQASGCANAFSPTHTVTVASTTWTAGPGWSAGPPTAGVAAIFNGNYTSTGNLSACSVQVNSGTVTINSGHTLTVQNGVNVSNSARLIFEDDASLVQVNNATNAGDITYKRVTTPMRQYDYTYWSSPVNAQVLANFSPLTLSDKYFWFNTTTYQWTAVSAPGLTPMTPGRGYIIRAPQGFTATPQTWLGAFGYDGITHGGGVPNNGTITVPVGHNSATNNLDCIGNPYPSAISANLFLSDSQNTAALGTGSTLYFWTHNTPITANQYNGSDYASYNFTGGVGTGSAATSPAPCTGCNFNIPDGNIAAGQAFMVETVAAGSVYFKNSMRLTGVNTQFFRMNNQPDPIETLERSRIWLEMTNNNGAYKQALVGYIQNATDGIDAGYDGSLVEVGNPVSIYTFADGRKLSIQGKAPQFADSDIIPLGYRSSIAGSFQINMPMIDGFFVDQDIYLEDTLLNIVHDLKQGPYMFTTTTGSFDTRFQLKFVNNVLSVDHPLMAQNDVVVYKNENSIFVETARTKMSSVKIFDLRGRLIAQKGGLNQHKVEFRDLHAANEVLLVQIITDGNVVVTKKVLF